MTVRKLRIGSAFVFCHNGIVYVRCHGGFRPGRGGDLIRALDYPVHSYTGITGIWQVIAP